MKKPNLYMVFQWVIFMPIILPLCLLFGALQGIANSAEQIIQTCWKDISTSDNGLVEF